MKKDNGPADLMGEEGHLTDEGVAFWVDKAFDGTLSNLSGEVLHHVDDCIHCKSRIIELEETLGKLKEVQPSDLTVKQNKYNISLKTWAVAAASLLILITVTWILVRTANQAVEPEELFAAYFEPFPDIVTVKNHHSNQDSELFLAGLSYYNHQKYDTAIIIFKSIHTIEKEIDIVNFYLAQSILAGGQEVDTAISLLRAVIDSDSILKDDATWYLALALMAEGKQEEAIAYLDALIDGRKSYWIKAGELKEKLL